MVACSCVDADMLTLAANHMTLDTQTAFGDEGNFVPHLIQIAYPIKLLGMILMYHPQH